MPAPLPPRPSLEWLRKTAKARLARLRETQPGAKLADAQREIAREHGFASWRRLRAHIEQLASDVDPPPDNETVSAFLRAVGTGRLDDVRAMLLRSPSLVNAVGPHPFWGGRPQALHVAIESNRPGMVRLLLDHGADVNGTNHEYDHWSPLMLAIDRDRTELRDELLARGPRVGLLEALMLADDERVETLLRDGLPEIAPNGGSILAFARTPYAIDRLIELDAPVDRRDRWGSTPIDAISRLGPRGASLVRHLVSRGIAVAPAEYARLGDLEALARLVEQDPSIARLDAVMMAAVDFGHHRIVEWLLARRASPNARSDAASRHTALHSAAWNGDLPMVRLLVEAGADPRTRDDEHNETPRGWADASITVTGNARCAEVVAWFDARGR